MADALLERRDVHHDRNHGDAEARGDGQRRGRGALPLRHEHRVDRKLLQAAPEESGEAPCALEPLVKEMIYLAVSVSNGCGYCIASHTAAARKAGMTDAMFGEVMAVTGMANETNRLANGYRVPIDPAFER